MSAAAKSLLYAGEFWKRSRGSSSGAPSVGSINMNIGNDANRVSTAFTRLYRKDVRPISVDSATTQERGNVLSARASNVLHEHHHVRGVVRARSIGALRNGQFRSRENLTCRERDDVGVVGRDVLSSGKDLGVELLGSLDGIGEVEDELVDLPRIQDLIRP